MRNKKYLSLIYLLFTIAKIACGCETDPLLVQEYTSFSLRSDTPSPDISLGDNQEHQRRRGALWQAIHTREVELVKSYFEKEFEWVNVLYLKQKLFKNKIPKSTYEEMQQKLLFTRQLFQEIDAAIAKEEAHQKWVRKLSSPGNITKECFYTDNCCKYLSQWVNVMATLLASGMVLLYCAGKSPSRISTEDPCALLPMGQEAQLFTNCTQSSLQTRIPCVIFNPHNETQIKDMYDCCQNLIDAFCMSQVNYYNDHIYLKQMHAAWMPSMILLPSILALQIAFQVGGCLHRRAKRLSEPIKQLIVQKKSDLDQVEKDLKDLQTENTESFQEL